MAKGCLPPNFSRKKSVPDSFFSTTCLLSFFHPTKILPLLPFFHRFRFILSLGITLGISSSVFSQKFPTTTLPEFDTLILKAYGLRFINSDSALTLIGKAKNLQNLSSLQQAMISNQLGAIHYIKGDYATSLREYSRAYQLLENETDLYQKVFALNGRGLIYLSQHEYEQAAAIFQNCIDLNHQLKDSMALGANYLNKGIALSEMGNKQEAMLELEKGIQITQNYPELPARWMNLNRQAQIKLELGQIDEAKILFEKVLNENPKLTTWEKTFSHTGLGLIALEINQNLEALEQGKKALDYAKEINAFWDKERATRLLSEAYERIGQYREALEFARLNKTYADSLYSQDKNSEISYLQLRLTEADNATLAQAKQISDQRAQISTRTVVGLSLILALLTVALLLYRRWLKEKENLNAQLLAKQKEILLQNEKLDRLNNDKIKLFSILSHDLRMPINAIQQILELQSMNLLSPEEKAKTDEILLRQVQQTDQMMDQLLRWSHSQMEGITTERVAVDLIELVRKSIVQNDFLAKKKEIQFDFSPADFHPKVLADPTHVQIIIQNCLQNAIKFSNSGGKIRISIQDLGNHVSLFIQDEGIGIPKSKLAEIQENQALVNSSEGTQKEKGTGLGLLLVKQFMGMNEGKFRLDSEFGKGTKVTLTFETAA
ncbi:signal transduction histidine kinase [Algoriphagus aquaeductus]|uniref:histidine kinase n=2 Tax=Algoriphagus aquaeductus TaxID=475299 RepID=A0A326RTB8_9BACT|nr:signal transduction histidine kinase [Algoriphagus aquaeductus]